MGLNSNEKRVCDLLAGRGKELLRDLAEHVAIPTGRGHVPGLRAYRNALMVRLQKLGATIDVIEGDPKPKWLSLPGDGDARTQAGGRDGSVDENALVLRAVHQTDDSKLRIMLCGHIDTVHDPAGAFQTLALADGGAIARGPGAADMKGGTLIAIAVLEALHESGTKLNWTYALNSDEETGSFHSARVLREIAEGCDVGLVTEPALPGGALAIERMGSGQFQIETFGTSAHVGREFAKGVSAVTALAEAIVQSAAIADVDAGRILSVGPIVGGAMTNAVPDHAAAWGNVRFHDPAAGEAIAAALDELVTAEDAQPRVAVHRMWHRPAKPMTDAVQRLAERARAAAADLGQSLPFERTGGVCDGNVLQSAGLAVIDTLGVRGGNLHRTDEFIEVASLVERSQLLAVLLLRLNEG